MLLHRPVLVAALLLVLVSPHTGGVPPTVAGAAGDPPTAQPTTAALPAARASAAAAWEWPLAAPHVVVRPFAAPATRYGAGHRGIDIAATTVSPTVVTAPDDGVVHYAGILFGRGVLSIQHTNGVLTSYEPVTTTLRKGDTVMRGTQIATLDPGHCAALSPCLHFGVRVDGEYLSPMNFLGGLPRSVLLPPR